MAASGERRHADDVASDLSAEGFDAADDPGRRFRWLEPGSLDHFPFPSSPEAAEVSSLLLTSPTTDEAIEEVYSRIAAALAMRASAAARSSNWAALITTLK